MLKHKGQVLLDVLRAAVPMGRNTPLVMRPLNHLSVPLRNMLTTQSPSKATASLDLDTTVL